MLPLHGLKVIDLSSVIFGPYCAQWLADLGADVIKLEAPEGDSTRQTGPGLEPGMAALFLGSNRSKRGLVLDLKTAAGQTALDRLLATADVLLHSIRPQKLGQLGLEPEALLARHPHLVFAGLHGFGEAGPYGGLPAYDDVIQGMSGIADLMAQSTGAPRYMPTIIADKVSGLTAGLAILAAIIRRQTTGKGGFVEIPMFETMVAFNFVEHFYGHHFDPPLGPLGYPRVMAPWRRPLWRRWLRQRNPPHRTAQPLQQLQQRQPAAARTVMQAARRPPLPLPPSLPLSQRSAQQPRRRASQRRRRQ